MSIEDEMIQLALVLLMLLEHNQYLKKINIEFESTLVIRI